MDRYVKLLLSNEAWMKEKLDLREDFFSKHLQRAEAGVSVDRVLRFARTG